MVLEFDDIIKEAKNLPVVPLASATVYHEKIPLLIKQVDQTVSFHPAIHDLIGNNPLQMMYDNHRHHAAFMVTVFSIANYELLARTVPWVYRVYAAHSFSFDYFPVELNAWVAAIDEYMAPDMTAEIKFVYAWMIKRHETMIHLSQIEKEHKLPVIEDWLEKKTSFLTAALEGDHRKCLGIAKEFVLTGKDIESFYLQIIQPVMYEVGMLWEQGTVSVAQEHLASAVVARVMASTSMVDVVCDRMMPKVVITAAPNEYHEIGAWMVSDILEQDGWDVKYLGANTPADDLFELLRSFKPKVLALSVTMPFNILKVKQMIRVIKEDAELKKIRVVIGGRTFNENPNLWQSTGADYFAANVQEIRTLFSDMEK